MKLGNRQFYKNEPVIYFDTLTASSLEGAATSVYAQGGRGYARLIAWEGERTMTFNMTDALLSPEGFAILSGAGLVDASETPIFVHTTSQVEIEEANTIVLDTDDVVWDGFDTSNDAYKKNAGIFIMKLTEGEITDEPCIPAANGVGITDGKTTITCYYHEGGLRKGDIVLVDYYVKKTSGAQQIEITPDSFGGFFYVEASTLFRRESDGKDLAAEFVIPRAKVQSNFTFSMAPTGDPSTFDFVLDAFPDYTKFDGTKKVFATIQIIDEDADSDEKKREHCNEYLTKINPSAATKQMFGKPASELQSNITINDNAISGTSKFVTDYTAFSSNVSEQSGNYLALDADIVGADEVTVQILRTTGQKDPVSLDDDRDIVLRLTPYNTIKGIEIKGKKNGEEIESHVYVLDLKLEDA